MSATSVAGLWGERREAANIAEIFLDACNRQTPNRTAVPLVTTPPLTIHLQQVTTHSSCPPDVARSRAVADPAASASENLARGPLCRPSFRRAEAAEESACARALLPGESCNITCVEGGMAMKHSFLLLRDTCRRMSVWKCWIPRSCLWGLWASLAFFCLCRF